MIGANIQPGRRSEMYNLQFKDTKLILDIPSIKIDSKQVFDDVGGNGNLLVDESFDNFEFQIYKSTLRGKSKVDNYDRYEIENKMRNGNDNIYNYWLHIKRNGKNKEI